MHGLATAAQSGVRTVLGTGPQHIIDESFYRARFLKVLLTSVRMDPKP